MSDTVGETLLVSVLRGEAEMLDAPLNNKPTKEHPALLRQAADRIAELERQLAEAQAGEFVCKRCGIRKNAEQQKHPQF